jgi:hypothetical protein
MSAIFYKLDKLIAPATPMLYSTNAEMLPHVMQFSLATSIF